MKRSSFKKKSYEEVIEKARIKAQNVRQKPYKALKRTKLYKTSKLPISKLQRKIWEECRRIALKQQANDKGEVDCYTCPAKNLQGSNRQLGHVPYPKSVLSAFLKYDLRILKWQCYHCNINCGGMGAEAYKRLEREEGNEFIKQLEEDRQKTVKAYDYYVALLEQYKNL